MLLLAAAASHTCTQTVRENRKDDCDVCCLKQEISSFIMKHLQESEISEAMRSSSTFSWTSDDGHVVQVSARNLICVRIPEELGHVYSLIQRDKGI
jgi:hypothetical protein